MNETPEQLVKSKKRVVDHGEVFTPEWLVKDMLDLVKDECERIEARFLEPACGSGNFLVEVLSRKLSVVRAKYGKSEFDRVNYALLAVMSIYGIELLPDNVVECRDNLFDVYQNFFKLPDESDELKAARKVLEVNIVHGDALSMNTVTEPTAPITFPEWAYLGKGQFKRRDYQFSSLTDLAAYKAPESLFQHNESTDIFKPVNDFPVMNYKELANV
jgi:hypothetical protein